MEAELKKSFGAGGVLAKVARKHKGAELTPMQEQELLLSMMKVESLTEKLRTVCMDGVNSYVHAPAVVVAVGAMCCLSFLLWLAVIFSFLHCTPPFFFSHHQTPHMIFFKKTQKRCRRTPRARP